MSGGSTMRTLLCSLTLLGGIKGCRLHLESSPVYSNYIMTEEKNQDAIHPLVDTGGNSGKVFVKQR